MTDSIRQQIIDAIDIRFKTILKTGDYLTDLGNKVFWWHETALSEVDLPAIICRDRNESREPDIEVFGTNGYSLPIEIELFFSGTTAEEEMRKGEADIIKAMGVDPSWTGLALFTEIETIESAMEQKESIEGSVKMVMAVHFLTIMGEPMVTGGGGTLPSFLFANIPIYDTDPDITGWGDAEFGRVWAVRDLQNVHWWNGDDIASLG